MKWILFFMLFIQTAAFSQYKNLVFEGGGTRGIAYAGAIKVLEEKNVIAQVQQVAGTSAGSIAALLIALNYSAGEIDSIMRNVNINKFNDGKGGIFGKVKRMSKDFGVYKGDKLEDWLATLVIGKTQNENLTFLQLHQLTQNNKNFKDLFCTGTNVSQQRLDVFSYQHTPNMPVKTAVHISCSIPFYFEPVIVDSNYHLILEPQKGKNYTYYVDGGMISNYPINMFDTCLVADENPLTCSQVKFNAQTLGLKLERAEQIKNFKNNNTAIAAFNIDNFKKYSFALSNLMMETLNRRYPNLENEQGRTIYINQGNMKVKIKQLSNEEMNSMFNNGAEAVKNFFEIKQP